MNMIHIYSHTRNMMSCPSQATGHLVKICQLPGVAAEGCWVVSIVHHCININGQTHAPEQENEALIYCPSGEFSPDSSSSKGTGAQLGVSAA
jgi:hypothetical protein